MRQVKNETYTQVSCKSSSCSAVCQWMQSLLWSHLLYFHYLFPVFNSRFSRNHSLCQQSGLICWHDTTDISKRRYKADFSTNSSLKPKSCKNNSIFLYLWSHQSHIKAWTHITDFSAKSTKIHTLKKLNPKGFDQVWWTGEVLLFISLFVF